MAAGLFLIALFLALTTFKNPITTSTATNIATASGLEVVDFECTQHRVMAVSAPKCNTNDDDYAHGMSTFSVWFNKPMFVMLSFVNDDDADHISPLHFYTRIVNATVWCIPCPVTR